MAEENFECGRCGEEFDSKRGLHIHQSRAHGTQPDDKKEETADTEESSAGIELSVKQFGGLMFALGILTGIIVGGVFTGGELTGIQMPSNDNTQNGNTGNTGSGLIELESGDYPYGNLEAGVGSGSLQLNGKTFNLSGEPYIGNPSAEVTAISYEDFECPYCKQYNEGAYPQIVENYVKTGEVQYFYKHLPLRIHPMAEPTAVASECALNQDAEAFWTFKQGFFDNQEQLSETFQTDRQKFDESMYRWAEQTGLNTDQFKQCYDNEETLDEVQQDKQQAGSVGAQATPTIFVDGQLVEGAQPYSRFRSVIDNALSQ